MDNHAATPAATTPAKKEDSLIKKSWTAVKKHEILRTVLIVGLAVLVWTEYRSTGGHYGNNIVAGTNVPAPAAGFGFTTAAAAMPLDPHCSVHVGDYLGTDAQCHIAGSSVPRAGLALASPVPMIVAEDAKYKAFVDACNEQSEKRKKLGLPGVAVITGGPGQRSTCHVEGGFTQTGAL